MPEKPLPEPVRSTDRLAPFGWFALTLLLRIPLVARIEGILDDDQSVVGLMALDIAAGRRFPIFFDGQRYMGALEAYTAAPFVWLLGHAPVVIALAPLLYHALFVALTYRLWSAAADRATAHLAALIAAVGSPMLVLWSIAPRGGYSEILAWGVAVIGGYRALTRPDRPPLTPRLQFGWGFLLALGYFLNPLSLVVYITLALDWLIGRHADALRHNRPWLAAWLSRPYPFVRWALPLAASLFLLALFCHVRYPLHGGPEFIFGLGYLSKSAASLGVLAVLLLCAWTLDFPHRLKALLTGNSWGSLGALVALAPMTLYHLRSLLGQTPDDPSLPVWIQAPWRIGPALVNLLQGQPALIGSDHQLAAFTLISNPLFQLPASAWPATARWLHTLAPLVALLVLGLAMMAIRKDRKAWIAWTNLSATGPASATQLATLGLGLTVALYLVEAASAGLASTRYLVIAWVFLPGLLAAGLRRVSPRPRTALLAALLIPWLVAQANLAADMSRPSPFRPIVAALQARGVQAVLAQPYTALVLPNLSHGQIGALQYQSVWPRLRDRYQDRFPPGQPVTCIAVPDFPCAPSEDLAAHLRALATRFPGRVQYLGLQGGHEIWQADLPLDTLLAPADSPPPFPADSYTPLIGLGGPAGS